MYIRLLSLSTLIFVLFLCACKKSGCTDEAANNYSSSATEDDGSCLYEGDVVFWYNSTTQTAMSMNNVTSLIYFVDEANIGNYSTSLVWSNEPPCGVDGSIGRTIAFSTNESHLITYSIEDQNGVVRFSGTVNVSPGNCSAVQLDW